MSRLTGILVGLCVLALLGIGGWWSYDLYGRNRQTVKQLQQAQASLQDKQSTLALVEEERKKLSDEYEILKTRWKETDAQLQQVTQESAQVKGEVASLSSEKAGLQQQVQEAAAQQRSLEGRMDQLRKDLAAQEANRAVVELQFKQAMQRSLNGSEIEQVSESFAQQRIETERLRQLLGECADQYEALLDRSDRLEKRLAENPQEQKARHAQELIEAKTRALETAHLAVLYQQLGDSSMANAQYVQAARAFEKSLSYQDSAIVHGKLAFIYDRLLIDHDKAAIHARSAPSGYNIKEALAATAKEAGLPRSSWKLVWQWLTRPGGS